MAHMSLHKSFSSKHYEKKPKHLEEWHNSLLVWSESLEKTSRGLIQNYHIDKKNREKLIRLMTRMCNMINTNMPLTRKTCLRTYRKNLQLQKCIFSLVNSLEKNKRRSWKNIRHYLITYPLVKNRITFTKLLFYHLSMYTKLHTIFPRLHIWSQKIAIQCDLHIFLYELSKRNSPTTRERPWKLSVERKAQVEETIVQNFDMIAAELAKNRIVTIPHHKELSKFNNHKNPTNIYLRYNNDNELEISINQTMGIKNSKLCGTHKDGSIHWVLSLKWDNTLSGSKNYGVYYHNKRGCAHEDFIKPIFKSSNGYYHLAYGGEDLVEMIHKKKLTPRLNTMIMLECILIIKKLHKSKRHHMDLKIDNIVVKKQENTYQVRIIDLPNNLYAGEKIGYMITAWHSIMPKELNLPKLSPHKRAVLNVTGAQVFHDCFALTQVYAILLKTQPKPTQTCLKMYNVMKRIQSLMVNTYHTLHIEKNQVDTVQKMNQQFNMDYLISILERHEKIDIENYYHQKILEEIHDHTDDINACSNYIQKVNLL